MRRVLSVSKSEENIVQITSKTCSFLPRIEETFALAFLLPDTNHSDDARDKNLKDKLFALCKRNCDSSLHRSTGILTLKCTHQCPRHDERHYCVHRAHNVDNTSHARVRVHKRVGWPAPAVEIVPIIASDLKRTLFLCFEWKKTQSNFS